MSFSTYYQLGSRVSMFLPVKQNLYQNLVLLDRKYHIKNKTNSENLCFKKKHTLFQFNMNNLEVCNIIIIYVVHVEETTLYVCTIFVMFSFIYQIYPPFQECELLYLENTKKKTKNPFKNFIY